MPHRVLVLKTNSEASCSTQCCSCAAMHLGELPPASGRDAWTCCAVALLAHRVAVLGQAQCV